MKNKSKRNREAAPHPQPVPAQPIREPQEEPPAERRVERPRGLAFLQSHRSLILLVTYAVALYCALQHLKEVRGFFSSAWSVFKPITVGFCMAFVLNVLLIFFEKSILRVFDRPRLRALKRPLGVALTLVAALGIVTLVALVVSPRVGESVNLIVNTIRQSAEELDGGLTGLLSKTSLSEELIGDIVNKLRTLTDQLLTWIEAEYAVLAGAVLDVTSTLLSFLFDLLVSLIIAIYVLLQKERIARAANRLLKAYLPERLCEKVQGVCSLSYSAFSNFVRGQLLEAVILGALCYVGLLILRIPYAPVVALLVGVTALIPVMGAWIGGGVSALLILMVDPGKVLLFIVYLLLLQQVEGNLIYPRVVGSAIGLPGLLVLCAVLVGGNMGGVTGMLLGVPVVAVLYELLRQSTERRLGALRSRSQEYAE